MCHKITRRVLYHEEIGFEPSKNPEEVNGVLVKLTGYFDPNMNNPELYLIQTAVVTHDSYTLSTTQAITQFTEGNPKPPSQADLIRKAIKTFDDLVSVHPVLSEATDDS